MDVKETEKKKGNRHSFGACRDINVYPKKHYWCGFDEAGRQKWFIELSNGRIVSNKDENYFFWLKKYTTSEKKSLLDLKNSCQRK